ncbi:hypothetical protein C8Q76DRAFT_719274 [Earliella scabrosa]|nr:hypothetical protein C8Q76DRAFT_719274 [Earliella scabrosa]
MVADKSRAFEQTWHDTTYEPRLYPDGVSVQLSFTGTAVYVYSLIANDIPPTKTFMNTSYIIDGETMGEYIHSPDASQDPVLYNVLVFHRTGLPNSPHTLIMSATGDTPSVILFDYALYTVDNSQPVVSTSPTRTTESTSPTQAPDTSISIPPVTSLSVLSSRPTLSGPTTSGPFDSKTESMSPIVGGNPPTGSETLSGSGTPLQPSTSANSTSSAPSGVAIVTSTPNANTKLSGPAVGGITAGVFLGLFLLSTLLYCLYKRTRRPPPRSIDTNVRLWDAAHSPYMSDGHGPSDDFVSEYSRARAPSGSPSPRWDWDRGNWASSGGDPELSERATMGSMPPSYYTGASRAPTIRNWDAQTRRSDRRSMSARRRDERRVDRSAARRGERLEKDDQGGVRRGQPETASLRREHEVRKGAEVGSPLPLERWSLDKVEEAVGYITASEETLGVKAATTPTFRNDSDVKPEK